MTRTRLAVDERRSQLLEAAFRLFALRPWESVSIDEIAAEAGVSKGLLYHYFPSKRDLWVAVMREGNADLRRRSEPDPSIPPPERVRRSLDGYLSYVVENAESYASVMRAGPGADPAVWQIVEDTRRLVVDRVLDGMGHSRPSPALRLALRGWVGLVESVSLEWLRTRRPSRSAVVELLARSLDGVVAAAGGL